MIEISLVVARGQRDWSRRENKSAKQKIERQDGASDNPHYDCFTSLSLYHGNLRLQNSVWGFYIPRQLITDSITGVTVKIIQQPKLAQFKFLELAGWLRYRFREALPR